MRARGSGVMELYLVPAMLFLSSLFMAFAWLGHIRFRHKGFFLALLFSWFLVLPEYLLKYLGHSLGTRDIRGE